MNVSPPESLKDFVDEPRELANRDVDEGIAHYPSEGAPQAALGFIDALEQAYAHIGRHPATGSSRYAHELNLPGLRFWPVAHHPHRVFYLERDDHIGVLHGQCQRAIEHRLIHRLTAAA